MAKSANRSELIDQSGRHLRLKCCTRCGGDMHEGRDIYGEFDTCLQCGHTKDVVSHERIAAMFGTERFDMGEVA